MRGKIFVDTNILIYYFQFKQEQRKILSTNLIHNYIEDIFLSTQVLGELFNVMRKKGNNIEVCSAIVEECIHIFPISEIRKQHVSKALTINKKYGYSYYDSLIIASALEAGCDILYTEDMQHNQLIENKLRILNPFK